MDEDLSVVGTPCLFVCDMWAPPFRLPANPMRKLAALALRLSQQLGRRIGSVASVRDSTMTTAAFDQQGVGRSHRLRRSRSAFSVARRVNAHVSSIPAKVAIDWCIRHRRRVGATEELGSSQMIEPNRLHL